LRQLVRKDLDRLRGGEVRANPHSESPSGLGHADAQPLSRQLDQQLVAQSVSRECCGGAEQRPPLRIGGQPFDLLADLVLQGG
jgi:hypothetical protein